jgi:hypothetical protein
MQKIHRDMQQAVNHVFFNAAATSSTMNIIVHTKYCKMSCSFLHLPLTNKIQMETILVAKFLGLQKK